MDEHQSTNPESVHGSLSTKSQDPARPLFFGVGCWDFGIRCQPSLEFTVEDYVAGLREQLEAIPSLNNLNITTLWGDTEDKITYSVTGCGTDFLQWKWAEMNRAVGEVAA